MRADQPPEVALYHWAETLQRQGLIELVVPLLEVLKVWGFLGSQALWMLSPLVHQEILTPWAEALERPELIARVQQRLLEGAAQE